MKIAFFFFLVSLTPLPKLFFDWKWEKVFLVLLLENTQSKYYDLLEKSNK